MRWRVYTLPRLDGIDYDLALECETEDPAVIQAIETAATNAGMWIERITPSDDWSKIRTPTDTEGRPT